MPSSAEPDFPTGTPDERELFVRWLDFLRGAVLRKIDGLNEQEARWTPDGALISLLGIVNHLTHVEWRWIDGCMLGRAVSRSEEEFTPGPDLTVAAAVAAYRERGVATDAYVRSVTSLATPSSYGDATDLRWVLVHLVNDDRLATPGMPTPPGSCSTARRGSRGTQRRRGRLRRAWNSATQSTSPASTTTRS